MRVPEERPLAHSTDRRPYGSGPSARRSARRTGRSQTRGLWRHRAEEGRAAGQKRDMGDETRRESGRTGGAGAQQGSTVSNAESSLHPRDTDHRSAGVGTSVQSHIKADAEGRGGGGIRNDWQLIARAKLLPLPVQGNPPRGASQRQQPRGHSPRPSRRTRALERAPSSPALDARPRLPPRQSSTRLLPRLLRAYTGN